MKHQLLEHIPGASAVSGDTFLVYLKTDLEQLQTFLRHPECEAARRNHQGVFCQMRQALDLIQHIVGDSGCMNGDLSPTTNGDSGIGLAANQPTASRAIKELEELVELTRVTLVGPSTQEKLLCALDSMIETTQDFTDSAYTSHENREKILQVCDRVKQEMITLLQIGAKLNQKDNLSPNEALETAIIKTIEMTKSLKKELQSTAMDQASDLFKTNEDHDILLFLKVAGMNGETDKIDEYSIKFEEHSEQLEEVCKLMRHIAITDPLIITAEHNESIVRSIGPMVLHASQSLAQHPTSKIAKENLEVFADAWECQINDISVLVKEVNDVCQGRMERLVYLSLPRPGKHGTTSKFLRPVKLDAEEQAKIAKLGLEMKLITSEMDAEADKWDEPHNDIVKRAKNMSSMAFSMYLFTRGEGPLKTTQDLFTQADYFAEEGNKLYKTVREFSTRVPKCPQKEDLFSHLDRLPTFCQQLQVTLKALTFGKAATFNKVDSAIQETKGLMNVIAKVVTACFICATKFNIDYRSSPSLSGKWRQGSSANSSDTESVFSSHSEVQ